MTQSHLLTYRSHVLYNQFASLLNEDYAFRAYHQIHSNFDKLIRVCSTIRDVKKRSLVSFGPFLLLMQRQGTTAYWSLASNQSYEAWVLVRPMLEACLIIGKWIDNDANAEIWKHREADRKAYQKAYQGRKLESKSLPRSSELRRVLSRINDDFIHLNNQYYQRHTDVLPDSDDSVYIQVHYFDPDEVDHLAHVFAFLHLVLVAQDSIARLWQDVFGEAGRVTIGLKAFQADFSERVTQFLKTHPDRRPVLEELGLWSFEEAT